VVEKDLPQPQPGPGELLVRVYAAGVTTAELDWYPTAHTKTGERRSRAVPGHEFSGINTETGEDVYGMNDWFADGAMAEYCVTRPAYVAPKPRSLTHVEAASVPIGALTAWQGLFDRAKLQSGDRVLVHGAAGGVGIFAVQLARYRGARVVATASAHNADFLRRLGVEDVIDYRTARFEDKVRDIDVVFDTVGGETLERSWGVLAQHGRMVTIAAASERQTDERVKQAFFIVEPNQEQLTEISDLIEEGYVRPCVDAVIPLAQASAVYAGYAGRRQGRGKLVVSVAAERAA
jgi:NADPH:quinone reductase-like Zn-dependent oxidoreductase